ncbi:MAG: transposase [Synechococcus sp. SB0669_bin_7]|nr:transposase [Synechococcus sp. SB0669_bin_7]
MDGVFWLCEAQLESIKPFFPQSPGLSRVDGSKVGSGSIYVHVTACALVDAPAAYGPTTPSPTAAAPGGRWEFSRCSSLNWSELV